MAHLDFAVFIDNSTPSHRDLVSLCLKHRCSRALCVGTVLPDRELLEGAHILPAARSPLAPEELAEHISGNTAVICASRDIILSCCKLLEEKGIPTLVVQDPSASPP